MLLDRMGLSPADLMATARARRPVPTFAEYDPGRHAWSWSRAW